MKSLGIIKEKEAEELRQLKKQQNDKYEYNKKKEREESPIGYPFFCNSCQEFFSLDSKRVCPNCLSLNININEKGLTPCALSSQESTEEQLLETKKNDFDSTQCPHCNKIIFIKRGLNTPLIITTLNQMKFDVRKELIQ